MTDSQFEALRQDLRSLRGDIDERFDAVTQRFDAVTQRFDAVETRLTRLEVQLEAKPDKAFVFQTLLTVNASFIALIGLAVLVFRSFLVPV
jgi:predicted secreted Zn-dependent protease